MVLILIVIFIIFCFYVKKIIGWSVHTEQAYWCSLFSILQMSYIWLILYRMECFVVYSLSATLMES